MTTMDQSELELLRRGNLKFVRRFSRTLTTMSSSPRLKMAVLCCIDTRIDPLKIYGLDSGQICVIRNAGNQVTQDVIGTLAITIYELGVNTVIILGHTQCGTTCSLVEEAFKNVKEKLGIPKQTLERLINRNMDLTNPLLGISDSETNVCLNVQKLQTNPLFQDIKVVGQLYDVETGKIWDVEVDDKVSPSNWIQTIIDVIHDQFRKFKGLFYVSPELIEDDLTSPYTTVFDDIRHEFKTIEFHNTYILTSPFQESLQSLRWDLGFERDKLLIFGEGELSKEKELAFNLEITTVLRDFDIMNPFEGISVLGYPEEAKKALLHRFDIPELLYQLESA
ncbi:MAG: beta-class carbonic anhydrase, partial [Promethearchaeota archaeon]